ncbi:MAG: tetratricopeptide repeat protein, partial [Phycisphaerae bacterium]|nr:tetratricopeptide repeat protein [Phycisphaerae bacterium]
MEKSPKSQSTLRQALARQWQVPLFVVSVIAFGTSLVMLRPETIEPTFDDEFVAVSQLAAENRYTEFYGQAEQLRVKSITQGQLGRVHGLVAQTRAQELNQRREFSLNASNPRSARRNYENIITDYLEAIGRGWVDPNSPAAKDVFQDMALAYWGLDEASQAVNYQKKAISVSETFDPVLHRGLVEMYLSARPKEYLTISLGELEKILGSPNTNADDKAWAFARKAEVLIGQGHEKEALVWLNTADDLVKASRYAEEVDFLRGRAMRHSGQTDQAELVLRDLLARMADRGDVYAQVALELGKINYEQYRDYDARNFYKIVVDSQVGKEWYVAGRLGLAECDAMQQRYDQAAMHYQAVVDLITERPNNRSVAKSQAQKSLAVLAQKLGLLKQYDLAIAFLELEQQMAPRKDRDAVGRYAMMLRRMAESLAGQIGQAKKDSKQADSVRQDDPWFAQQNQLKVDYYVRAAQQFLRLADLTVENSTVYSDSLWSAAMCYDRAGEALNTITTLKRYVDEHVGQTEWTDALYYLAQAHQSVGHFDEAITYYSTLRNRHPNMPAAINSIIPMARCYLSLEPPVKEKAEQLLLAVLSDPAMTPRAPKFHEAMIELGKLYYDSERYDEAIPLLKEAIDRNPDNSDWG